MSALGLSLLVFNGSVQAFQPSPLKSAQRQQQPTFMQAMVDPSDIPSILTGISHHTQAAAPMMDHVSSTGDHVTLSQSDMMSAWLSTMYSTIPQMQAKLRTLMTEDGHWKAGVTEQQQQQIFDMLPRQVWSKINQEVGIYEKPHFPRDLNVIDLKHSIKPNLEELVYHHQIEKVDAAGTAKDLFPQLSEKVQTEAQATMDKGKMVLDAARIRGGSTAHDAFIGSKPTATLLAPQEHSDWNGQDIKLYESKLKWTTQYLRVLDKLPFLAFYYAIVEFFFLRKNFDVYKEEVEEDPEGVAAETLSDFAVRVGIFFVLAMLTVTFT
jgi:hypothetical protein